MASTRWLDENATMRLLDVSQHELQSLVVDGTIESQENGSVLEYRFTFHPGTDGQYEVYPGPFATKHAVSRASVMHDREIVFRGDTFTVFQTWNGRIPDIELEPESVELEHVLLQKLCRDGQVTLEHRDGRHHLIG